MKNENLFILAIKGILFIYLPVIFLFYITYGVVLEKAITFRWETMIILAAFIAPWIIKSYKYRTIVQDVEDFNTLKASIIKSKWDIIEQDDNRVIVKPKFDFPFRLLISNKIQIKYSQQKIVISGPQYYVDNMAKDFAGKSSIWTKRATNIMAIYLIILSVSSPIVGGLGLPWEIKKYRHSSFVKNVQIIEINPGEVIGNSVENTNNHGYGVENDEYAFYVDDYLNLIRVNKDFQDKEFLIQKSTGTGINGLNLAGNWIYYKTGKNLNRIRTDGTDNETIYNLGYLFNIHMKDNWLYFINILDNFNVYRMDINGRGLERFLKVSALDIALYDNTLIISHGNKGKGYVESINLDSGKRQVELEVLANSLTRWDGYYYFIGDDNKLYRKRDNGRTAPQLLIDNKVWSYIITDAGIFYSLHSENEGYSGQDIYKIGLDGTENTLILNEEMEEGFTKIGDYLLFRSAVSGFAPVLKRLNIFTNEIKAVN